jgi:arylsulfatase A-like enzyme
LRDTKVVDIVKDMDDQAQLCKRFTDEAVSFIRKNKDKPFFVYLPHAFVHGPRRARKEFMDRAKGNATRAQIEEVDWSTGQILQTVRKLGLEKDTMVIFTSDNGGAGGCSSKPLRGGKGSTWEGGLREPTIAWWPGTVPAKSSCDEVATTMDLLPTFAALGGGKTPDDRVIDGKDISGLLLGRANAKSPHKAFFYYSRSHLRAVRCGEWKLHTNGQLYNLDKDIGEKQNVAKQNPDVVARLKKSLDQCRADLDNKANCRPVGKVKNPKYLTPLVKTKKS